jgi:probable HAF family extracellular repeat protein
MLDFQTYNILIIHKRSFDMQRVTRKITKKISVLVSMAFIAYVPYVNAGGQLISLGDLSGGDFNSRATGISADGSIVVGVSHGTGANSFRWTETDGMVRLGNLPEGGFFNNVTGISGDGSVAIGFNIGNAGIKAVQWTDAGGMTALATSGNSVALGSNVTGSVIVGAMNLSNNEEAFRWTQSGSGVGLGFLTTDGSYSRAFGTSADGSVVIGESGSSEGMQAFRWTQSNGMTGLGDLAGGSFYSSASAVSANGSVVVGFSESLNGTEAFRWTESEGMLGLGAFTGWIPYSSANAVNADGSVIAGESAVGPGDRAAFLWTMSGGVISLMDLLIANNVDVSHFSNLISATGLSADGKTITGYGRNSEGYIEAYIARVTTLSISGPGNVTTVPEPASTDLLLAGLGLAFILKLRKKSSV